jgi:hypothetical protein
MPNAIEVHDPAILAQARAVLDACRSGAEMQQAVLSAVQRNADWRGKQCINLLAPEAPTSPAVRALLGAEIGTRAAEGHIGAVQRCAWSCSSRPFAAAMPITGSWARWTARVRQHGRLLRPGPAGRRDHERGLAVWRAL